jgi:hypothetical protein
MGKMSVLQGVKLLKVKNIFKTSKERKNITKNQHYFSFKL